MIGQDAGSWRVSMDVSMSRGLSGGHPETEGLTADGRLVETVLHQHEVELDLTRFELGITRTFSANWDGFLRIPYFIKDQQASVIFPFGGTDEERADAIRNGYAHHRTETYEGFSDLELGVGWKKKGLLGEGSIFRFSLGLTIPAGATEEDPLVAGDLGLVHNHVQFGNGTFDPLIDVYYGRPLGSHWAFSVYGKARIPLYENSHGFQGGFEGTLIPRLTWLAGKKLSLSAGLAANYYDYTEWNGRRDPNSGQFTLNAALSAGYKFSESFTASLSVLAPLYTDSFSTEDALDPAPVVAVSAAWTF